MSRRFAYLLGIDIDDARNGLLLFKPVEWAFDCSRLSFYEIDGNFVIFINDAAIYDVKLFDKLMELTPQVGSCTSQVATG